MRNYTYVICLIVILTSCSHASLEHFKKQGDKISAQLARELESVKTKEDLQIRSSKIKKKIDKLSKLMIEAKEYALEHREEDHERAPSIANDHLLYEMERLCQIDGMQELLEKLQRDSLDHLDEFNRQLKAKKYKR